MRYYSRQKVLNKSGDREYQVGEKNNTAGKKVWTQVNEVQSSLTCRLGSMQKSFIGLQASDASISAASELYQSHCVGSFNNA